MKKAIILGLAICAGAFGAYKVMEGAEELNAQKAETTRWIEADSLTAINARIAADFPLTRAQVLEAIQQKHPEVTDADIDTFVARHYIEATVIDGEQRFHRKAARNIELLNPAYNGGFEHRGASASAERISYVDSVLNFYRGTNPEGLAHEVTYRFTVDVPYSEGIKGDTLRVWMPLPLDNALCGRQSEVVIVDKSQPDVILSGDKSVHNTVFFTAPAPAEGDTAHFEYVGKYITAGQYVSADDIKSKQKPYDKTSETYTRYTRLPDGPHIIDMKELAYEIVGEETDPFRQSELVYDYIINRYPWAGAREYSTLACIPQYVIDEGHGDCGQVSLLYISLMRSLGVPARWESGWMLHPGEVNLHDWAEVYFEGVGWVPVDVSFGRYTGSTDPEVTGFYSHGIDSYRMASNKGVGGKLYPEKKYVRSETVDFQLGEVETSKGNLYYPAWSSDLQVIDVKPVTRK